jgi:rod shape-determining protein MreD
MATRSVEGSVGMRRAGSWAVVVVTALVLQSTIFAQVTLVGARPELVYLATIVLAFLEGPSSAAVAGFFGGMAQDFLLDTPKGITALTLTLVGYVVGNVRQYVTTPSPLVPVFLVGAGTSAAVLFDRLVAYLLGTADVGVLYVIQIAILSGVYNMLLTPFLFPVIRRVAEASRPSRVFR